MIALRLFNREVTKRYGTELLIVWESNPRNNFLKLPPVVGNWCDTHFCAALPMAYYQLLHSITGL